MNICIKLPDHTEENNFHFTVEPQREKTCDMCAQRRLVSVPVHSRSLDQSLRCPYEETLHPRLSKMHLVKILIRLRECRVGSRRISEGGWGEGRFNHITVLTLRIRTDRPEHTV